MVGVVRGIVLGNVERKCLSTFRDTMVYSKCKSNANRSWASHSLRNASTEIFFRELRPTLYFDHICVQFL